MTDKFQKDRDKRRSPLRETPAGEKWQWFSYPPPKSPSEGGLIQIQLVTSKGGLIVMGRNKFYFTSCIFFVRTKSPVEIR